MTKIAFELPLSSTYNEGPLQIEQHTVPVEMELTPGEHLFTSAPIEIGIFHHYKVFAHLTIPYSYDPEVQELTIAGPTDTSDQQLAIQTSLDQHPKLISRRTVNRTAASFASPNMWADHIDNTPEVKQVHQTVIRATIAELVKQLINAGVQGVVQTGAAPIVTPDNYQSFKATFAPEKTDEEHPLLEEIIEMQAVLDSTYGGTITWYENTAYSNVIGSTNDPKIEGFSWIYVWMATCNDYYYPKVCSSLNYSDGKNNFDCNKDIENFVGGHVVRGEKSLQVAKGGTCYIFPICKRHNAKDNIYMSSRYYPEGVILINYMKSS
jgi:hypothetical protein